MCDCQQSGQDVRGACRAQNRVSNLFKYLLFTYYLLNLFKDRSPWNFWIADMAWYFKGSCIGCSDGVVLGSRAGACPAVRHSAAALPGRRERRDAGESLLQPLHLHFSLQMNVEGCAKPHWTMSFTVERHVTIVYHPCICMYRLFKDTALWGLNIQYMHKSSTCLSQLPVLSGDPLECVCGDVITVLCCWSIFTRPA